MSFLKGKIGRSAVIVAFSLGAFQTLGVIGATVASAAPLCTYSGAATGVLTVNDDLASDFIAFDRDSTGVVTLSYGGPACTGGPILVANLKTVTVQGGAGDQWVQIGLDNTDDGLIDGWGTVDWTVTLGSEGADGDGLQIENEGTDPVDVVFGASGFDIDNDGNLDVSFSGVENFEVASNSTSSDKISGQGSTATGGVFTLPVLGVFGPVGGGGEFCGSDGINPIGICADGGATSHNKLYGGSGNDGIWDYGSGDATIGPGAGDNFVDCVSANAYDPTDMSGGDTLDYSALTTGVTANLLAASVNKGVAGLDNVPGCDNVIGTAAVDSLTGDGGSNILQPGGGNDTVDGGAGDDAVDYSDATDGVTVDLNAGTSTGGSGTDALSHIEDVNGSEAADDITGDDDNTNSLLGEGGNDSLAGGSGDDGVSDYFDGGAGIDTANYGNNTLATTVDLGTLPTSTANGNAGEGDIIVGNTIENAILGTGDDTFFGSVFNNIVWPNGGQNSLSCVTTGCGGIDTVNYSIGYTAGVLVNLSGGGATGGSQDSITGFTNAVGTAFNDTMIGTDLVGGTNGANLLVGGKGNDNISANAGPDFVRAGAGNDRVRGGSGDDTLKGQGGKDNIRGSGGADDIFGGKGKDFCTGGGGNDFIKTCERPRHHGQGPNGPGLHQRI